MIQRLLGIALLSVCLMGLIVLLLFYPLLKLGTGISNVQPFAVTSLDKKLSLADVRALYPCAQTLRSYVVFSSETAYDREQLKHDFFYFFDGSKNQFDIFSPYFVGSATVDQSIVTSSPARQGGATLHNTDGTTAQLESYDVPGHPQYNIRLPYLPPDSPGTQGYFYITVDDDPSISRITHITAEDPSHAVSIKKINLPPEFVAGPAQNVPKLSEHKNNRDDQAVFHALSIEDMIWHESAANVASQESAKILIGDMIARLVSFHDAILARSENDLVNRNLGACLACIAPRRLSLYTKIQAAITANQIFDAAITQCSAAAQETGLTRLQDAVDSARAEAKKSAFSYL